MSSAAASGYTPTQDASSLPRFLRAVWLRLAGGAVLAAFCAWLVAFAAPLRSVLVISVRGEAIGLSLAGVGVIAAPFILWVLVRVLARAPTPIVAGTLFWLFAVMIGLAANTLFLLFFRDSIAPLFVLAAVSFAALALVQMLLAQPVPGIVAALVFVTAGGAGAYGVAALTPRTWPFIAADLAGVVTLALVVASRAGGLARRYARFAERRGWATLVNYGALYALALADPARPQPSPDQAKESDHV
jgi:FtsH-binding integral membrane protein